MRSNTQIISDYLAQIEAFKEIIEQNDYLDPYEYREDLLDLLALYGWHTSHNDAELVEEDYKLFIEFDCRNFTYCLSISDNDNKEVKKIKYYMNVI